MCMHMLKITEKVYLFLVLHRDQRIIYFLRMVWLAQRLACLLGTFAARYAGTSRIIALLN